MCNLGNVHPFAEILLKNQWLWHHLKEIILYLILNVLWAFNHIHIFQLLSGASTIKITEVVQQQQKNNMNTNSHLYYVSDTNVLVQRFLHHLQDYLCQWYSICFGWGGENARMFKLQKKELSLISNVGNITSCRALFKHFTPSTMSIYIKEILCSIKLKHR